MPEEAQLVKHQLSRADPNSNEYSLTVQVPNQVSHSFDANVVLDHVHARRKKVLRLSFTAEAGGDWRAAEQAGQHSAPHTAYEGSQRRDSYHDPARPPQDDYSQGRERNPVSWYTYLFMLLMVVLVVAFILINCSGWDPAVSNHRIFATFNPLASL